VLAITKKHGLDRRFTDALLTRDAGSETGSSSEDERMPVQAELWPSINREERVPEKRGPSSVAAEKVTQRVMMTS
jgi:hypothetical protein